MDGAQAHVFVDLHVERAVARLLHVEVDIDAQHRRTGRCTRIEGVPLLRKVA